MAPDCKPVQPGDDCLMSEINHELIHDKSLILKADFYPYSVAGILEKRS